MKSLSLSAAVAAALVLPSLAVAQAEQTDSGPKAPPVVDVRLHQDGTLLGQVVTAQSSPASRGRELATATTDKNGYFAFAGLHDGVYQLVAAEGQGTFRVWSAQTAPPAAQPGALVVTGKETVRGQGGIRRVRNALANPVVAGGLIAAGIAIPIAVDDADDPGTR